MKLWVSGIAVVGLAAGAFATPVTHEARVFCDQQLLAGGFVSNQFALQQGEVAAFMTTPVSSFGTNFASPDTIVEIRDPASTVITSSDDAGDDARGNTPVGPTRGSLVRYGVATPGMYDFRVRGFGSSDAGTYVGTYVRFTPGGSSDFTDTEANNTSATAQAVSVPADTARVGFGGITGDIDFFAISVNAGDVISAFTIPLSNLTAAAPNFSAIDTLLDVRAADGSIITTSDDAGNDAYGASAVGPTRGSAVRYEATASGTIFLSVSGFDSAESGSYALAISICSDVPAPGTASGLVLAGLPLVRRRRR